MKTIHKLCTYLLKRDAIGKKNVKKRCDECPAWEMVDGFGRCKKGCRAAAEEILNISKHGNPWGKKYRNSRKSWPDRNGYKA